MHWCRFLLWCLPISLVAPAWVGFAQTRDDKDDTEDAILEVERTVGASMLERLTAPEPAVRPRIPSREEELFGEVLSVIEAQYYDTSVTRGQLLEAAVQGMLDYLNARTVRRLGTHGANELLAPDEYLRIRKNLSGQITGIGVVARRDSTSGSFEIVRVLEGSPGARSGLMSGDRIVAIDGFVVETIGQEGAIRLLRGRPGSPVKLSVLKHEDENPSDVVVIRGEFRNAQVSATRLDPCTGYLRVPNFGPGVAQTIEHALMDYNTYGVGALIIDLRDNPGGALDEAVSVANLLLEKGSAVVRLQTRDELDSVARTTDDPVFEAPVTVLVDSRTGGAAEVLASALQQNRRAAIVGTRTSGRATAESIYPLSTGAAIRLSTAVYRDPLGQTWAGAGLEPLVNVQPQPYDPGDPEDPALDRATVILQSLRPEDCIATR